MCRLDKLEHEDTKVFCYRLQVSAVMFDFVVIVTPDGVMLKVYGMCPADEDERVTEAKRMLREADENGDGKISKEEFSNLLRYNIAPDSLSMYDDRLAMKGIDGSTDDFTAKLSAAKNGMEMLNNIIGRK